MYESENDVFGEVVSNGADEANKTQLRAGEVAWPAILLAAQVIYF